MLKTFNQLRAFALLAAGMMPVLAAAAEPVTVEASTGTMTIEADRAAAIARENTGGRVLDVRLLADDAGPAYAVRLLLDPGRVRTVLVDGNSGQLH